MTAQQQQQQQSQAQPQQQQQAQQQTQQQQQQQQQQQRDYNVATLCRYGQEHLLDLVSRSQELFNLLKVHQVRRLSRHNQGAIAADLCSVCLPLLPGHVRSVT